MRWTFLMIFYLVCGTEGEKGKIVSGPRTPWDVIKLPSRPTLKYDSFLNLLQYSKYLLSTYLLVTE